MFDNSWLIAFDVVRWQSWRPTERTRNAMRCIADFSQRGWRLFLSEVVTRMLLQDSNLTLADQKKMKKKKEMN